MKRFTSTRKWEDPWFRNLSPTAKLLWGWILDHCDNAGVLEPDYGLASFQIGHPIKEEHISELGDRVKPLNGKKLFIEKFVAFQFGELSPTSRVHASVLNLLNSHGIPYTKGMSTDTLSSGIVNPSDTLAARVKDKDKEKEKDIYSKIVYPLTLSSPGFKASFEQWMKYRLHNHKKVKDWALLFNCQLQWLSRFGEVDAIEILNQSLRNGWQGLFELKATSPSTMNGGQRPIGPSVKEATEYAVEKGLSRAKASKYAASFVGHWAPKKWMRKGSVIDWKVEFSHQISHWKEAGE